MDSSLPTGTNDNPPSGWKLVSLGDVASVTAGGTPSRKSPEFWGGPIPWVTTRQIDYEVINEPEEFITKEGLRRSAARMFKKGSILLALIGQGATRGKVAVLGIDAAINQNCLAVCVNDSVESSFVYHNLANRYEEIRGLSNSGGQSSLNAGLVKGIRILLPPAPEQIAIALVGDTWDRGIRQLSDLIAAKLRFKQGLMQQLLTGKRRFPEFRVEWDHVRVGNIASERSERNNGGGSIPVLSCTKYDGLVDSLAYFGKRVFSEDTSNYKVVRKGDFAYATNHIEEGSIGLLTHTEAGLVSPMYTVFRTDGRIVPEFLFRLLKTETYRQVFESFTSASVNRRGSLRWKQFATIPLKLPSVDEQNRIDDVLAVFDREIDLLRRELDALKTQKKGLMQKLLTGHVRVPASGGRQSPVSEARRENQ
jgi:type I restriction enzyme S subunit